jgi:hypothetical protein
MAWIAFILSFVGMAIGVAYMEVSLAMKGFITMSFLFSTTASFMLAKVVRDKYESEKFLNKMETAKTEKFLHDNSGDLNLM